MIATGFAPVLSIKHSLFIFLVVFFQAVGAQTDSTGMVKFTPDFKFEDGIFVNFDQVRQNSPIPKSRVITTVAYDEPDFFERVLQEKRIALYDNLGTRQEISTKNLWGFSRNGVLYINLNEGYYRITIVGNICHFVASLTTYSGNYNPYNYYGNPYYNNYPYYNPYYSSYPSSTNSEMRQYLLDFKTGNVLDYEVESMELLLMTDPELHDEFASLSGKKQKQLKFMYIRKFNERNPLFIPKK